MDIRNLSVVRQLFANTVLTHKVQEVAAEIQEDKAKCIKTTNILIVSLILIFLFLQAFFQNKIFSYIGIGLTISEVIFLIIQLTFNFDKKMDLHKKAAIKYMELRGSYLSLITDIMNEKIDSDNIIIRREQLKKEYNSICDSAPQTNRKEYCEAQKRLGTGKNDGEDFTWSDKEIDRFLPEALRLEKKIN